MSDPYRGHRRDELVVAVEALTKQVARLAWASEFQALGSPWTVEEDSCRGCGSQILVEELDVCPACGEQKRTKEEDPDG